MRESAGAGGGSGRRVGALSFSPLNHKFLVSAGADGKLVFADYDQRKVVKELDTNRGALTAVTFVNGVYVAAGTASGDVLVYDLRNSSRPTATLSGHTSGGLGLMAPITAMHFHTPIPPANAASAAPAPVAPPAAPASPQIQRQQQQQQQQQQQPPPPPQPSPSATSSPASSFVKNDIVPVPGNTTASNNNSVSANASLNPPSATNMPSALSSVSSSAPSAVAGEAHSVASSVGSSSVSSSSSSSSSQLARGSPLQQTTASKNANSNLTAGRDGLPGELDKARAASWPPPSQRSRRTPRSSGGREAKRCSSSSSSR